MAIRLSGLVSGLDTDAIIEELVSAYSTKKDSYVKAQTKLEWKQEAWKDLNTKIYGFYSSSLSSLRFSSAFNKKVASSTSSKANVTAGSDAVIGTQTLEVKQLAKSGYLTGGVVKNANNPSQKLKGSSKLSELGITGENSFTISVNGKETTINANEDMSINELVVQLKDAGVSANFDENNQRFFVSATKSGKEGDFTLNADSATGIEALKSLGLYSTTAKEMSVYQSRANMDVDAETDAKYEATKEAYTTTEEQAKILEEQLEAFNKKIKELTDKKAKNDYRVEYANMSVEDRTAEYNSVNSRLEELKAKKDSELTEEEKAEKAELTSKLETIEEVDGAIGNATLTEEDKQVYLDKWQAEADKTNEELAEVSEEAAKNQAILDGTANADELGYSDLDSYVAYCNEQVDARNAELEANIRTDLETQKATAQEMVSAYEVVQNYATIETPTADNKAEYEAALAKLGMSANGAVRIEGQDAQITLNGADFTSTTNNFTINGLTIQATAVTDEDEVINITTDQDIDGMYNMIKDFITEYNTLVNEMDSLYNAASAKGYEPLTEEEKTALSEKEVDKWEEKIRKSLLRRDSTLDSVTNAIKNAMSRSYSVNGEMLSLSSFGIKTLSYFTAGDNERGAYHIDGDSDDKHSSGNTDKLREALAADPDKVTAFFNKLAEGVYTELTNKMKASSVSSAYTVYNDKQMQKEYNNYKETISDWEDKIEAYEEKYRKQFSAMETALSKLNSQQSALGNMLGGL
ncbi:MAG: flagellar filament capping protein FliD [Lachnospiraceae bacterium]|nr:flagellar filament capping protein FliD [Lachnospiraceae bacterium]